VVVLVIVGELLRRQAGLALQVSENFDHRALLDEPLRFDGGFIVEASPAGMPTFERRGTTLLRGWGGLHKCRQPLNL
jgi:hypothetical protein